MTDSSMISLENIFLPDPYGLVNTGSICYFNSLLQVLGSCTSIYSIKFKDRNDVERVIKEYVEMLKNNKIDITVSSKIIAELHKVKPNFGNGQESASEALVLLLEAIDNVCLTSLFVNRVRCSVKCKTCDYRSEEKKDYSVTINLFHEQDVKESNILNHSNEIDDYLCEKCKNKGGIRHYKLTMLSEILVICFNVYFDKKKHNFPDTLTFPGKDKDLRYKLIGQIEHIGNLHGGHYWSRVLRKDGVFLCNDNTYNECKFTPTDNTYIIVYHIV